MIASNSPELSLFDLGSVVLRRRKLAGSIFLGSVAASLLVAWLWPRQYESESKLYIRLGRESRSLDPTAAVGRPTTATALPFTRENELNSITEILLSRVLLERLVDAVGPDAILWGVPAEPTSS